jgi:hypothetical protein
MHTGRLFVLAGVIVGIIGLFMKSLRTAGESVLPTLHGADPSFPGGIPTIWGGLATWAQIVLVILLVVVVALAFMGTLSKAMGKNASLTTAVIGVALLAYVVFKMFDAFDSADTLEAGFAQAAGGGAIQTAYTVSAGFGFFVLLVGTVLVIAGGLSGMRGDQ